ncbi:MAG: response regulator [Candidatus Electrothrix sp. AR4]|nr:response regulator [Candidatus Electrothrix sp. AR4]
MTRWGAKIGFRSGANYEQRYELDWKFFEPYFTTKAQGEGTGLGLALTQSIILDFGGDITVTSELGQGTLFHIYLPTIATSGESTQAKDTTPLPKGNERIMVVDDDREFVKMSKRLLENLGYQVTALSNSLDAFNTIQQRPYAFDLVLTDMTMPQMTGDELSKKILSVRPDIPIIICTGFSELMDENKAKKIGARTLVMKPFTKKELAQSVREVLDKGIV